ncbi:HutD family protein [Rosenbergiella epipactidis]|uniref:HutD/Ves family protein n=1 Tax=Rosenbergiella epipactidis TaxID=1544694 RepID=UPI001BDA6E73|nr:HutD family protein [Rosenbergiella epipactidis]MBT0719075.1 HutD family protein [Rosenbergiella epipactidis]
MTRLLCFRDATVMPWKNGQGETREIWKQGDSIEDYDWRISVATIHQSGRFSRFDHYLRNISVLEGGGMHLDIDDQPGALILPFQAVEFDGSSHVYCRVNEGPLLDFNVIYRAGCFKVTVDWNDGADWHYEGGTRLLLNASAKATVRSGKEQFLLDRYDCLLTDDKDILSLSDSPDASFARVTLLAIGS